MKLIRCLIPVIAIVVTGCITPPEQRVPLTRKNGPQIRPVVVSEPPPPALPPPSPPLPTPVEVTPPAAAATANPAPTAPTRRVGVIFGPGGARSFAYIGVLREFERRHIPIDGIIGLEWGALPAALFAQEGRANDVEWQMFKMKADVMPTSGLLKSAMEPQPTDNINAFLKQAFGDKQTNNSRVRFMCPYTTHEGEHTAWANNGKLKDLVALCLPYTPVLESHASRAAPFAAADAAMALRRQGFTDIVMVNVLGGGPILAPQKFSDATANEVLWSEIRAANRNTLLQSNWPIEVPIKNSGLAGLDKARDFMAQGQKAAAPVADRMANSLGLMNAN